MFVGKRRFYSGLLGLRNDRLGGALFRDLLNRGRWRAEDGALESSCSEDWAGSVWLVDKGIVCGMGMSYDFNAFLVWVVVRKDGVKLPGPGEGGAFDAFPVALFNAHPSIVACDVGF